MKSINATLGGYMKLVNMKEKKSRDYYIEYFNNLSLKELNEAKTNKQMIDVVNKNINVTRLLEQFICEDELVDFHRVHYLLDNAIELGYQGVFIS